MTTSNLMLHFQHWVPQHKVEKSEILLLKIDPQTKHFGHIMEDHK
jgi:hypothetical protein